MLCPVQTNVGNPQLLGQKAITFFRQVPQTGMH